MRSVAARLRAAEKSMRNAAAKVADATDEELEGALSEFGFRRNEWFNARPRDSMQRVKHGS